ncbi:hypothetical protein PVAP13_4NG220911 [Panicum virgatum]|uniref:CCHC-type domain-containing protein n=1 Tax=Panicum virgatum TaxID=38727 RepID=A0A8T0TEH5_PANVG|nr:hypothetical protein PVAP13_4NG220911 [Panicum virgatum]
MTCKVHLYGLNPHLWTIMCVGVPQLREGEEVTPEHEHDLFCNAQAVRVIQSSLCTMEYNKVRGMISAKEIWETLQMSHEGNDEVKEGKMDLLQGELESFVMKKDETLQQMDDRLTLLVTEIRTLGSKDWDDFKVTKNMLRAYAPKNPMFATIIRGKESYRKMKPINLLNELQFHEMNEQDVAKSIGQDEVKTIALKAEPSKTVETSEKPSKQKKKVESSDGDSTDEETAMMMRNFKKFMKKKEISREGQKQRTCYKCGAKDHFIADCPQNDNDESEDKKHKGKSKDKSYDKEKRYKEKSQEYKKKYGKVHVGQEWESSDDSNNEGTASLALLSPPSTPKLFNNLSDDEDEGPMYLMAKGTKVTNYANPPSSPTSTSSEVENDLDEEKAQLKENMIKKFGKLGYKQIKKLMEKLEKKKEILREQEELLILEKERNLALEESLAKKKDKVEKLAMDLSLAKDSNLRILKNAHSELQKRHSRLEDIYKNLEVNYSTLWEKTKSNSKATLDSNASTSKECSKCHNHDINACVTNLAKLKEAIKAKDAQIHKFPSIHDGLGYTRENNANGSRIVNGKSIPFWKKGANLGDLMNMAHRGTKMGVDQGKNKVENTTKVNTSNKNVPSPISRNYSIDYIVVIQNGKMVVKYIGAHTRRLRSVWVPKMAYTNL